MRRIYLPIEGQELPFEPLYLAGLLTGRRDVEGWNQGKSPIDFFDAKGILENIFSAFQLPDVLYTIEKPERFYHPGKACNILLGDEPVGSLGELHPDVQEQFGIEQTVYYFELNVEHLVAHSRDITSVSCSLPVSRHNKGYCHADCRRGTFHSGTGVHKSTENQGN